MMYVCLGLPAFHLEESFYDDKPPRSLIELPKEDLETLILGESKPALEEITIKFFSILIGPMIRRDYTLIPTEFPPKNEVRRHPRIKEIRATRIPRYPQSKIARR